MGKKKDKPEAILICPLKSGWQDSNLRPPHPKCGAIPGYATSRLAYAGYYDSSNQKIKPSKLSV
jgi:hypothetical protein